MKVKQLIKKLQKLPENAVVVLSSDAEGNSYSELYDVVYNSNEYWLSKIGDFYYDLEPSEVKLNKANSVIVLYPG